MLNSSDSEPRQSSGIVSGWLSKWSEMSALERLLWAIAGILVIAAIAVYFPGLESPPLEKGIVASQSTRVAFNLATPSVTPSPRATVTRTSSATPTSTRLPTLEPLVVPSLPANGKLLKYGPDPAKTGWVGSKQRGPRWADSNLHGGRLEGEDYSSVVQFDLRDLAPSSKILFAALEITGRSGKNLGTQGEWTVDLIEGKQPFEWGEASYDLVQRAPSLSAIGAPLFPKDLATGVTNRFILSPAQVTLLEKQLQTGAAVFRVSGPETDTDNLFTWDASPGPTGPILYLVAIPGSFVVITRTATPINVITAAAISTRQTLQARQYGTPSPLPRIYATAMALTTGTLTPTPARAVTTPALPAVVPVESLTPLSTPTQNDSLPAPVLVKMDLPGSVYNKIVFLSGDREKPLYWMMDPDGTHLSQITERRIYDIARAKDWMLPNGSYLYNAPDAAGTLQIWLFDPNFPEAPKQLTFMTKGISWSPTWALGNARIAFVSSETKRDEIYTLDLEDKKSLRRITTSQDWFWNQYPSWSPDGTQIVFCSDRDHVGAFTEIWVMNSDGSNPHKLGDGTRDAWAPVWVKWKK